MAKFALDPQPSNLTLGAGRLDGSIYPPALPPPKARPQLLTASGWLGWGLTSYFVSGSRVGASSCTVSRYICVSFKAVSLLFFQFTFLTKMKGFRMAQPNIKHTVQVLVLNRTHGSELALPRTVILAGLVTAFRETQTQRMMLHWRGGRGHCPWWKSLIRKPPQTGAKV